MKSLITLFLPNPDSRVCLGFSLRKAEIVKSSSRSVAIGLAGIMACSLALAAGQISDEQAWSEWREDMVSMETPGEGCFQATFPSTLWQAVPCLTVGIHTHPLPRHAKSGESQTTGNGNDYALVARGLISQTVGSFPKVTGVSSEVSVGVPAFGDGGILGPNEYTLQVNTNADSRTSACSGGDSSCTVWQQFLYGTDYETHGKAAVFMQYWLINYGASGASCPSGYITSKPDCYKNSKAVSAPDVGITDLDGLKLTGSVAKNGNDTVKFMHGTTAYSVSASDSVLRISTVWKESEFNVVGESGGSEAVFNPGSAVTVHVAAEYGSTAAPDCASNAGTTGETNSLNLGSCTTSGGASPSIQFTESAPDAVNCSVFNDGYADRTHASNAIFINSERQACIPNGTASGDCRKWFGTCSGAGMNVNFKVFNDGYSDATAASNAIFINHEGEACIPNGKASGNCRKWFGLGAATNGQPALCRVFDDGYANLTATSNAIFINSEGEACIPNGKASGTCRKWWGYCELDPKH